MILKILQWTISTLPKMIMVRKDIGQGKDHYGATPLLIQVAFEAKDSHQDWKRVSIHDTLGLGECTGLHRSMLVASGMIHSGVMWPSRSCVTDALPLLASVFLGSILFNCEMNGKVS